MTHRPDVERKLKSVLYVGVAIITVGIITLILEQFVIDDDALRTRGSENLFAILGDAAAAVLGILTVITAVAALRRSTRLEAVSAIAATIAVTYAVAALVLFVRGIARDASATAAVAYAIPATLMIIIFISAVLRGRRLINELGGALRAAHRD